MGLRIATNVTALNAHKNLYSLSNQQSTTMARLASGYRINNASDDAAGLAISEGMKANIRGFRQANRNANDGISLVQIAEGGLNEVSNMLTRLRELAIQAASDTISDRERGYTDVEYQQLKEEIQRVSDTTEFNGVPLINGIGGIFDIQVGVKNDQFNDRISFDSTGTNSTLEGLGLTELSVIDKLSAQDSLAFVDDAINAVSGMRANIGAFQSRLTSASSNLMISDENLSAANSRIRDTDVAAESTTLAKTNILMQAATAILGQANTQQQLALKLLPG
jgi:flagellin